MNCCAVEESSCTSRIVAGQERGCGLNDDPGIVAVIRFVVLSSVAPMR